MPSRTAAAASSIHPAPQLSFSRALPEASPAEDPDGFYVTRRDGGHPGARGPRPAVVDLNLARRTWRGARRDPRGPARRPMRQRRARLCPVPPAPCRHRRHRRTAPELAWPESARRGGDLSSSPKGRASTPPSTSAGHALPARRAATGSACAPRCFAPRRAAEPGLFANEAEALAEIRADLEDAALLWAQCGVSFRGEGGMDVRIATPPPPYLVSFGPISACPAPAGSCTPANRREAGGDDHSPWSTSAGGGAPLRRRGGARGLPGGGLAQRPHHPGASGSADVLVSRVAGRGSGALARVEADGTLCTDPTLAARLGSSTCRTGSPTSATWTRRRARSRSARW